MVLLAVETMPHALTIADSPIVKVELSSICAITEPQHPGVSSISVSMSLTHNVSIHPDPCLISPPLRSNLLDCLAQHRFLLLSNDVGTHMSHLDRTSDLYIIGCGYV